MIDHDSDNLSVCNVVVYHPNQQLFNHVGMESSLPGYETVIWETHVSSPRI